MSIKSLIQIIIFLLMISIIGAVYYKYFYINEDVVEEINTLEKKNDEKLNDLIAKIAELELKNNKLALEINNNKILMSSTLKNKEKEIVEEKHTEENKDINDKNNKISKTDDQKNVLSSEEVKNLVKDVEYNSIDERGNKFYLLANSGKSNISNSDILDLVNVRGEITSDNRDTIYIVSDFAQFNSVNSNSKFYENVIINYQEKQITCINFDIDMETNKAIAYNDVVITDPKSKMRAGLIEFDLKTKNININPDKTKSKIQVITN